MKQIFTLFIIAFFLKTTLGCASKSQGNASTENNVVKIIKLKVYEAKRDFDKSVIDEPVYAMPYDENLDMDLYWSVEYFDKYDNILKLERYKIDDNGKEEVLYTTYYQYYSPEKKRLSSIKTEHSSENWNEEEKYIRNSDGLLMEIIKYTKLSVSHKTVFTYNATGQKVKEEIYEQKGLKESFDYTYDSPQKDESHIVKEIHVYYDLKGKEVSNDLNYESSSVEIERKWSNEGKVISSRRKEFQKGELLSDRKCYYNQHIGDIATEIIEEGFDPPIKIMSLNGSNKIISTGGRRHFRSKTIKTLDSNNNVIEYTRSGKVLDEKDLVTKSKEPIEDILATQLDKPASKKLIEPGFYPKPAGEYEDKQTYKYTYNKKNEWTEVLHSTSYQKYIITREIKYLD
jgi:hypothetical protein